MDSVLHHCSASGIGLIGENQYVSRNGDVKKVILEFEEKKPLIIEIRGFRICYLVAVTTERYTL
ncbi:MAG: hypothetical protein ACJAVI_000597 [Candidatus Azotimanducaceae bacterium]|jgi:hypothetical protein